MTRPMKDSGVEWIGEVPAAWNIVPLKRLAKIQTGSTPSKTEDNIYFSTENGYLWIKAENLGTMSSIETTTEYLTEEGIQVGRLFPENTVYVCCIASVGKVGFCTVPASCNQQINALMFHNAYWKYGFYLTVAQEAEYLLNASGNVMKIINSDKQSGLMCPFPPLDEQKRIAEILDQKCVEIDAVIAKTKATIEDYKKLRQALVADAITKGIRTNCAMKDSNNQCYGKIPSHWDIRKLKYMFRIKKDIAGKEGYTVLSITQRGIMPKNISSNEGQLAENYSNYQLVEPGDFAMNHMDLLTGWVDISRYSGVTSPDYRVFVLLDKENNYSKYYLYLMQMCYTNRIFYGLGQGVSGMGRWRLQADKFLNFTIPVPSYEEQKEIADYLDKKCAEIDTLIEKKTVLLAEMETYKKSVIYEYITGKKEVP